VLSGTLNRLAHDINRLHISIYIIYISQMQLIRDSFTS